MEYYRNGRALVPIGGIFDTSRSALEFVQQLSESSLTEPLNKLSFSLNEDGYLLAHLEDHSYYLSTFALKDLCRHLKLPSTFINKFPSGEVVLYNLNQNPYLPESSSLFRFIIWKWDDEAVIAGLLPANQNHIPLEKFHQILAEEKIDNRPDTVLDTIVFSGEEVVLYFLARQEITNEGFSFKPGFAVHYSPIRAADTLTFPFYQMSVTVATGEVFDFDFESPKKMHVASRQKSDFEAFTLQLATQYEGEDLGVDIDNSLKKGMVARQLSNLKFALLKSLKSRATSVYGYSGMKIKANAVEEEVIPEYRQFLINNREVIKTQEKYQIHSMLVDFSLPVFYNRLFTFRASSENPYYFVRYRKAIGVMFDKILEEVGDIILT